jgi:hypothetical protein
MKNRIASYIYAFEHDKLDEYYKKKGIEYGLNFCPVCGLKKIYTVFDVDGSILKTKCANPNCPFIYNPNAISIRGEKVFATRKREPLYERRKKVLEGF